MKPITCALLGAAFLLVTSTLQAQAPQIINYQGRVLAGSTNFNGTGQFKFALVNSNGTTAYWSNDGSLSLAPGAITPSSQPTAAVSLTVTNGLYSVLLGDTSIANMTVAVPSSVFTNSDVRLRVWFDDGTHGPQLLSPDQRIAAVGYSFMADNIKDGAITTAKLGSGAVTGANIANGAVGTAQLGSGAVTNANIGFGAVGTTQLQSGLNLGGTTTGIFSGNGASLNSLNASNISSGTIGNGLTSGTSASLPNTLVLRDGTGNFSAGTITANGSALTSLNASNISSGTIANSRTTGTAANTVNTLVLRDASGNFSAGTITANGSALTNLNAANITTGTLPAAQLPATVALTTGGNNFTGIQTITGDFARAKIQAATAGNASFMEFDDSTGGTLSRNIIGADGNGFSGAANQFTIATWTNTPLAFYTNQVPRLTIEASGRIDVAGAINIPTTSSSTVGVIQMGGTPIISAAGLGTSIFVGQGAGNFNIPGGQNNTATGSNALSNNTSGAQNTAIGASSLTANTTGSNNTATGVGALSNNTLGSQNTAIGVSALAQNRDQSDITAVGFQALNVNTAALNTAIGALALASNTTGGSSSDGANTAIGIQALRFNTTGSGNTASGANALESNQSGSRNTAVGSNALAQAKADDDTATGFNALSNNTSGAQNTAIGASSLTANTTGSNNTATGVGALSNNTLGSQNTAIGVSALAQNRDQSDITAVGFQALNVNTAALNTAIGALALTSNTTGGSGSAGANTAIGIQASRFNTTGSGNTASGANALKGNQTGDGNTAFGSNALTQATGSFNIGIGLNAGQTITTGSNDICIGSDAAAAGESNTTRIGTSGTQTAAFIAGISGVTASGGAAVFVTSSGQLGTLTSSRRFKTDIKPMDDASSVLLSLKPVTFHYKPELDAKGIAQFGLIAEEVAEICPDLVIRDEKGEILTVRYEQVNAMLLNEFLKEHERVAELNQKEESQLAALRDENASLRAENSTNAKRLAMLETRDKERDARLTRLEISQPPTQTVSNAIASGKESEQ